MCDHHETFQSLLFSVDGALEAIVDAVAPQNVALCTQYLLTLTQKSRKTLSRTNYTTCDFKCCIPSARLRCLISVVS